MAASLGARHLVAVSGLLLISACTGGGDPPGVGETLEGSFIRAAQTWDLNRDGMVTCDEWKSYASQLFDDADANRDGRLTSDEFAKIVKQDRLFEVANFKYFDAANQGFISKEQFVERANPAFTVLDRNNTCSLTRDQLRAATTPVSSPGEFKPFEPKQ